MQREIYLDNNATTKPLTEVSASLVAAMGDRFGNASSIHSAGARARDQLRSSRQQVAHLLGAGAENLIFTSSGTEANNLVLHSAVAALTRKNHESL